MSDELLTRVRAWLAEDPDPDTRAELGTLLEAGDLDGLAERFGSRLGFGTAGLRGRLGAGPGRMNRVVVQRAAAGLAEYLHDQGAPDGAAVAIGHDARHLSAEFAEDTARILTGAGFRALRLPAEQPTPLLAFAVRDLGCVAGVMVTASHNPAGDNGYKVYLGDGSQIASPADIEIATRIDRIGSLESIPRGEGGEAVGDDLLVRYRNRALSLLPQPDADGNRERRERLLLVYTPLHGVGGALTRDLLVRAGFADPRVPAAQAAPDPEFPTVRFPNPEEPGALDQAIALATEAGADLVLAQDPDADRCAVAVPTPAGWRILHGDEIGALLADHLLRSGRRGVYACSVVSSGLLAEMAAAAGQPHARTLTGFKWLGRVPELAFAYEEALGYCVDPETVRDKDGVTALLLLAEIAATAKAEGRDLAELLDGLVRRYGLFATDQVSVRFSDPDGIAEAMIRLRHRPPDRLGGLAVIGADDLREGLDGLPPADGLRYVLSGGGRVIVRPSGTEPKLKCYLEVQVRVEDAPGGVDAARFTATARLDAIGDDLRRAAGL